MTEKRLVFSTPAAEINKLPALIEGDTSVSYLEYHRRIAAVADKLAAEGIQPGMRVAVLADNSIDYIVTLMALMHTGAVACPISTRYPSGTIARMLETIECRVGVAAAEYAFDSATIRFIPLMDSSESKNGKKDLAQIDMEQDATILFTSGTTTIPKAVLHSFGNHCYNALGSNLNISLKPGERWLLSLPLYHVGGLGIIIRCLLAGATVVVGGARTELNRGNYSK